LAGSFPKGERVPTKTTSPLSEVGNFFQSPKFHSITRHFIQEPTKASFSRRLESMDVIPGAYKDFFRSILSDGHEFPYTILTPTHNGYKFRSVEKLICGVASEIHILEKRGDTFADLCFPVTKLAIWK